MADPENSLTYTLLTPLQVSLPDGKGNLDLDGPLSTDMLLRPQMPLAVGQFDPEEFRKGYPGELSLFQQIKLPGDPRILCPAIIAEPMQTFCNYLFSRDPQRFEREALFARIVASRYQPGQSAHAPKVHCDIRAYRFLHPGKDQAQVHSIFSSDTPAIYYPNANPGLKGIVNELLVRPEDDPEREDQRMEEALAIQAQASTGTSFPSGTVIVHGDAAIHQSGRVTSAVNRLFGGGTQRMSGPRDQTMTLKLVERLRLHT